jgi:hypothetical protein
LEVKVDTVKRKEEATSKETLKDLEDVTKVDTDETDETDGPSPDGAFDQADELKKADPV